MNRSLRVGKPLIVSLEHSFLPQSRMLANSKPHDKQVCPKISGQMCSHPTTGDTQPSLPCTSLLFWCILSTLEVFPNGTCSLTQDITINPVSSDLRVGKESFFYCQRLQDSCFPSCECLSLTHSIMVYICPSYPASKGSDLPFSAFLVKPLSELCSFPLIAHSPFHTPCSSLPWFRAVINLWCWCPWRGIPLLLVATDLTTAFPARVLSGWRHSTSYFEFLTVQKL